jgi:hypothetical protein
MQLAIDKHRNKCCSSSMGQLFADMYSSYASEGTTMVMYVTFVTVISVHTLIVCATTAT